MSNATQTFREVQRKANAGERIKIVAAVLSGGRYKNGDELVVDSVEPSGVRAVTSKSERAGIFHREYVVLEPIAPTTANLPDLFAQFIRDNAGAVRKYLAEIDPVDSAEEAEPAVEVTESLTRAKVIEMARERVAELKRIGNSLHEDLPKGTPFHYRYFNVEFHVNRDKRTVTALVHVSGNRRKPDAVGIAKCAPDDVFNADIGKAIAAERALGLTLTEAFVNAPKPEKAVAGVIIRKVSGAHIGTTRVVERTLMDGKAYVFTNGYNSEVKNCAIIDDTDADYTQEGAKDGEAA
ncbi:hypothetical protein [Paenibacillus sp. UASWS1643]|uniref:hypothetical protein n=1 Tax=Paenibacillus sp. UASWS1643 TaxID=2580422 RepID=UPI00123944B8|nr:hypothetical protein [Paenibacillus sp. UASWS1643]KAA8750170.1 hypothetical protein FE296_16380 [Paenibacillus sp. UASWS1643]